jgi:hypothetical protein
LFFHIEMIPEKHKTNELLKRQMAGVSLEDPEPEPLIKREKGKWKGTLKFHILNYTFLINLK